MTPRNTRVSPEVQTRGPARSFVQSLDNFYTPARDRRSEQALQEGLGGFSALLGEKAAELKKEQRSGEFQQGIQDAIREEAGQELKGVQTGSIFRQHSKYYMAGLNETRGKAAAARFKSDLSLAYQEWEGKHTDDDGTAFRDWMNQRVAEFTAGLGDDQYKLAGALPTVNEVARNFAAQHTGFTASRLEQESFEAYDEIVSGIFSDLNSGELEMDAAVELIASEADDMYTTDGAKANDRVVSAAIRYANIHNDPDALITLARGHDSGKFKLSQSNREKIANAMDAVEADMERETSRRSAQERSEAEAAKQAALNGFASQLEADPYAPLPKFADVGDHSTYAAMVRLSTSFQTAAGVKNPAAAGIERMAFEVELSGAESASERMSLLAEFISANPNALTSADVSKYTKEFLSRDDPNSVVNHPTVSKYRTGFGETLGAFQTDNFSIDQVAILKTQGQRHFDDYMLSKGNSIDVTDPASLRAAVKEAEEYAVEQLAFSFPEQMRERAESRPAEAGVLGVNEANQRVDEAVEAERRRLEEEAKALYQNLSGTPAADGAEAAPLDGAEASPEGDLPIEEQPTPFEDASSDEPYTPTRQGFYGELLNRFTDGRDTRDIMRSAIEVYKSDPEFATALDRVGEKFDVNPAALMAVMDFETGGTFSTSVTNAAGSGATGLIQFMPQTARSLGTTTEALAQMSRAEQMVYVEKYFDQFGSLIRGGEVDDLYMAVLWPKAIGKEDGYVIFREGTTAYRQNAGLDTNKDGTVTKYEAASKVTRKYYGY